MSEASRMNVSVSAGEPRKSSVSRLVTLERVVDWIRLQELDDYTTNGLIKLASQYPTAALPSFRKNFNLMIQRVRAQRKKELKGEDINAHKEETVTVQEAGGAKVTRAENFEDAFNQAFKSETSSEETSQEAFKEDWQ